MRLAAVSFWLAALPLAAQAPPKLDLNAATAAQLEAIRGIGPTTAARIVRIRERNGPYRCLEELRAVPRLTEAQLGVLIERAYIRAPDPRCPLSEQRRRAGRPVEPEP